MLVRRTNIMKALTIVHSEITITNLRNELKKSQEKRKAVRILAVLKLLEGKRKLDIANFLGYSRVSLTNWVRRVNQKGLAGLREKIGRGLKSQLTKIQKQQLKKDLLKSPKEFGFSSNLWTGRILKEHLQKNYGKNYRLSMMYVLFKELGFTLQRPTRKFLGVKPEKQVEFKRNLKKNHQRNS